MKCPSCSAQVEKTSDVCHHCGNRLEQGSSKKTMMGLPAITDDQGPSHGAEPTKKRDRSTLFGIPAATGDQRAANQHSTSGLAEGTAPGVHNEDGAVEEDDSTRVVSDLDLGEALGQESSASASGGRNNHATAFGLPASEAKQNDDDVASAWGLAEDTSEGNHSATQVAGAALANAIFESKQGAGGFSKTTGEADNSIRGTLMGMSRDELDEDSTREVSRSELDAFRRQQAASQQEPASESELEFEEDEDETQALGRDELAKFEERIQSDRRKQLLKKLRSKSKPGADEPAAKPPAQPHEKPFNRMPTGPRFSIPKPGSKQTAPDELAEVAVEPLDEPAKPPKPGIGGGRTSFPIASGGDAGFERELSDDELEIALDDTGVVSGDEFGQPAEASAAQPEIRPFEDDGDVASPPAGIREFRDDDDFDEPIFPIDSNDASAPAPGKVDLSADFEPAVAQPHPGPSSTQRSEINFGETPASGTQVAPQQPAQRPQAAQPPLDQQQMGQPTAAQPEDPTAKLIKTVQAIFGVLGALFLIGAGAYGFLTGGAEDTAQKAVAAAPALVGLIAAAVALLPLSGRIKSVGFVVVALLAGGALAAGALFSASTGALLLVLGGLLLVLCAAAFPLVLKVVQ